MAEKKSDVLEPRYDGALIDNKFVKAGIFVVKTKAQRNTEIKTLYRKLDGSTTTLCYISGEGAFYELISNPSSSGTTDQDWKRLDFGVSDILTALGSWDADNTTPVLQDTDATGQGNAFYTVTGAATPIQVQYAGLFEGAQVTVKNGDWIISNGTSWFVSESPVNWDTIANIPQTILDYVAGTVIAHQHEIADVNGLQLALDGKFDTGDVGDPNTDFATLPDAKLMNVGLSKANFYQKSETYTQTQVDNLVGGVNLLTTKGDLLSRDGATNVRVPVGADGQIIIADAAEAAGWRWGAAPTTGWSTGSDTLITANINIRHQGNRVVHKIGDLSAGAFNIEGDLGTDTDVTLLRFKANSGVLTASMFTEIYLGANNGNQAAPNAMGNIAIGQSNLTGLLPVGEFQGGRNIAIGNAIFQDFGTPALNNDATHNIAIGRGIGAGSDPISYGIFMGYEAGVNMTAPLNSQSIAQNIGIGLYALYGYTGGDSIYIGDGDLVAIGTSAFSNATALDAGSNGGVAIGSNAGAFSELENYNTIIGTFAGYNSSLGRGNIAMGVYSLSDMTGATSGNIGTGQNTYNVAIGVHALQHSFGNQNVAIGVNTFGGYGQAAPSVTGDYNTGIGGNGAKIVTGSFNSFFGAYSGARANGTQNLVALVGDYNTFLGAGATFDDSAPTFSNSILIASDYRQVMASNTIYIGSPTQDVVINSGVIKDSNGASLIGVGGNDKSIQFNDNGAQNGDDRFQYDPTNNNLQFKQARGGTQLDNDFGLSTDNLIIGSNNVLPSTGDTDIYHNIIFGEDNTLTTVNNLFVNNYVNGINIDLQNVGNFYFNTIIGTNHVINTGNVLTQYNFLGGRNGKLSGAAYNSFAFGYQVEVGHDGSGFVMGVATGAEFVRVARNSHNFSGTRATGNTDQTVGHGAGAIHSAILGGVNHNIPFGEDFSAIIGGEAIKADASSTHTVYLPKVKVGRGFNGGLVQDDTENQVAVIDSTTGLIGWRDAATLGGGGGVATSGTTLLGNDFKMEVPEIVPLTPQEYSDWGVGDVSGLGRGAGFTIKQTNIASGEAKDVFIQNKLGASGGEAYANISASTNDFNFNSTPEAAAGISVYTGTNHNNNGVTFYLHSEDRSYFKDDKATPTGLEYWADYSGTFVDRSLIDKGYADGAYWGLSGTSTLTGATVIKAAPTTYLDIYGDDGTDSGGGLYVEALNQTADLYYYNAVNSDYHYIRSSNTGFSIIYAPLGVQEVAFTVGLGGGQFIDGRTTKTGIIYDATTATGADFTDNSLINKGYADGAYILANGTTTLTSATQIIQDGSNTFGISTGTGAVQRTNFALADFSGVLTTYAFNGTDRYEIQTSISSVRIGATISSVTSDLVFSATSIVLDDAINSKGIEYAADYSTNFTARSLIDKGFADGAYWKTTGDTTLGGVQNIINSGAGARINIYSNIPSATSMRFGYSADSLTTFTGFKIAANAAIIEDAYSSKGVVYDGDYSANFTARSLIDKGYADGAYVALDGGGQFTSNSFLEARDAVSGNVALRSRPEADTSYSYFGVGNAAVAGNNKAGYAVIGTSRFTSGEQAYLNFDLDGELAIGAGVIFTDLRATKPGIEYDATTATGAGFSANSLINKGYADGAYWKTGADTTITSAINITTGTNTVLWGVSPTAVTRNARIAIADNGTTAVISWTAFGATGADNASLVSEGDASDGLVRLQSRGGTSYVEASSAYSGIEITGNNTGAYYASEQTAGASTHGDRWIPDKGYVDSVAGGGAFTSDAQTQITPSTAIVLDETTGAEVGLDLSFTANKAAGDVTGLKMYMTDTATSDNHYWFDFGWDTTAPTSRFRATIDPTFTAPTLESTGELWINGALDGGDVGLRMIGSSPRIAIGNAENVTATLYFDVNSNFDNRIFVSNTDDARMVIDANQAILLDANYTEFALAAEAVNPVGATTAGVGVVRLGDVSTAPVGALGSGGLLYVSGTSLFFHDDAGVATDLTAGGGWALTGTSTLTGGLTTITGGVAYVPIEIQSTATAWQKSGLYLYDTGAGGVKQAGLIAQGGNSSSEAAFALFVSGTTTRSARMTVTGAASKSEIKLSETSMVVEDSLNSKGLTYLANYSTNFTARSLVDKGYTENMSALREAATGDEVGWDFALEVDKLTSGAYTGIKLNVTETDVNTGNLLMDLGVGGNSMFTVSSNGAIVLGNGSTNQNGSISVDSSAVNATLTLTTKGTGSSGAVILDADNLDLGNSGRAGSARSIVARGSGANVGISMESKGTGGVTIERSGGRLSFFGGTPVIKQTTTSQTPATFAANTSGISDDTATWNGYTMGDLVAILQAYGLLT